ncbi:MAG: hypothetical protein ACI965_001113 [Paraglaciecola sp.]
MRVRCEDCHHEHLLAFSWPLLRIHVPAALGHPARHHAEVFVRTVVRGEWHKAPPCWLMMCCPMSQWILSFPFKIRFLFASYPQIMRKVLGIVYRTLATHITKKAGNNKQKAKTGTVTQIQRLDDEHSVHHL